MKLPWNVIVLPLNGYRYFVEQVIGSFGSPVISLHLCPTCCKNYLTSLSKITIISIDIGMKWCVLTIETYLVVLCIAASLAADPAADDVAVRCESA